jgi:hypothetical protein
MSKIIAPVVAASVAPAILSAVADSAVKLALADMAFDLALPSALSDVARAMGTDPTFDHWNGVCYAWKVAYRTKRNCAEKTSDNRWTNIVSGLETSFELAKPAKPTEGGKAKQASRDSIKATVETAKAQCVKPSDALERAAALIKQGKAKEAAAYTSAAIELSKDADSEATKCAKSALKDYRDNIKKEITAIDDAELLRTVLALLRNGLPKKGGKAKPAEAATY